MTDKRAKNPVSIGGNEEGQYQVAREAHVKENDRKVLLCIELTEHDVKTISESKMASEHDKLNEELDG